MKITAIIPVRHGSTRFSGKPLALIAGTSMIQRVYEAAQKVKRVTQVIVATDDQRIYDAVNDFGGKAIMTSEANRSGTDRVADAANQLGLEPDDIVVNVQGDQPLLHPDCIDELIEPFFTHPELQMTTLGFKIVDENEITNPKDVKVTFDHQGYALYFSRSTIPFARDAGTVYDIYKHLGFYAYKKAFLDIFSSLPQGTLENVEKLEQLRILEYGYRILVVVTEHDSPEVDLPEDIARVEKILTRDHS